MSDVVEPFGYEKGCTDQIRSKAHLKNTDRQSKDIGRDSDAKLGLVILFLE